MRAHTHKHQENHLKREGFFSRFDTVTLPPTSVSPKEYNPIIYSDCAKSKRAFFRRREGGREKRDSRRPEVKRAKELELVVVDKRARRKESRVLDSNGESGALGGLCPVRGGRGGW